MVGVTLQLYDHGARDAPQGRLLRRPGHLRRARSPSASVFLHYVLDYESRFKEAVIDRFAESYIARRDAGALRRLQHVDQVPRSARSPRANWAPTCWRPDTTSPRAVCPPAAAGFTARARKSATRAISCSAPRTSSSSILRFPLGDRAKSETRELARQIRPRHRRQARQPGHLFRADRALCRHDRTAEARRGGAGEIVDLDGKVLGKHAGIIHYTIGQRRGLGLPTGAPLYVVEARRRAPPRRRRSARGAAHQPHRAARRQLDRRRRARRSARHDGREVFVKVRSTRPPQAGWLKCRPMAATKSNWWTANTASRPARLACSTMRASGQARVLGGGFIKSAAAATNAAHSHDERMAPAK